MRFEKIEDVNTREVVRILKEGGVIVAPTDTVYGLICDATNKQVVAKIYDIKGRNKDKPLSVFVGDLEMLKDYAVLHEKNFGFLEKIWPGKITVVLPNLGKLPRELEDARGTTGFRIPKSDFILKVMEDLRGPLAQTSANLSNESEAKSGEEAFAIFTEASEKPDLILEGGESFGGSSSLVDLSGERSIILREGAVLKEELYALLKEAGLI